MRCLLSVRLESPRRPALRAATLLALAGHALGAAPTPGPAPAPSAETAPAVVAALPSGSLDFIDQHCSHCHNDEDKKGGLDLTALAYNPADPKTFSAWVRIHDRVAAGEMPPAKRTRPPATELESFVHTLGSSLDNADTTRLAEEGRATQRRLNGLEYENALRDLFQAPWLQVQGQFPADGESERFNKIGDALDVSYVQMARYLSAADYAIRQALTVQLERPPTRTQRHYARDQKGLLRFELTDGTTTPDRLMGPVLGTHAQPEVRARRAPVSVGPADPILREQEALVTVHGNYGFGPLSWDDFRAPVAGRYRVRVAGYTLWVGGGAGRVKVLGAGPTKTLAPQPPDPRRPNFDVVSPGRRHEPVTLYAKNAGSAQWLGTVDFSTEPTIGEMEVWLQGNASIEPEPSRFFRSRPTDTDLGYINPLATPDGIPAVAFKWLELEGPLYDEATAAGYRLLFGELPLRTLAPEVPGGVAVEVFVPRAPGERRRGGGTRPVRVAVESAQPRADGERLLRAFIDRAYRRPVAPGEAERYIGIFATQLERGLGFTQAMIVAYTAVLASPGFVFVEEQPGPLSDYALATRLALFLWNSPPDTTLRDLAARGELHRPEILHAQTERLLNDPKSRRFVEAFTDYWLDLRKINDTTPSLTLYNDYYLDDYLIESAVEETRLFVTELIARNLPARNIVASDFVFLNEHLAQHYGIPGVKGPALRRVTLPPDSPRGGLLTQASILKVTANGTTTSPVLRGVWISERILGLKLPPPPAVPAVEPDIRGAVTIREQLARHRSDPSCSSCHAQIDPPGFALESFDVFGAWRDRYRGVADDKPAVPGYGKNGWPFQFHYALPVDPSGELPDGRAFADVRSFKQLLLHDELRIARTLAKQLTVYATGAPIHFSDRARLEKILEAARPDGYGVRSLIHGLIQSDLFLSK